MRLPTANLMAGMSPGQAIQPALRLDPYAMLSGRAAARSRRSQAPSVSEEEESSVLRELGSKTLSGISTVANILDTPGAMARNALMLQNPFTGFLVPDKRPTGRDVLEKWGALRPNTPGFDAGDVAGFAAEVAMDPLTYISSPLKALGGAGKAAKAAGLLGHATEVASKKLGREVGVREARQSLTLGELIGGLGDRVGKEATDALAKRAKTTERLDKWMTEPLGGLLNVGGPFGLGPTKTLGTGGPISTKIAQAADTAGQAIKYSPPVRAARMLFAPGAGGAYAKEGQQVNEMAHALFPEAKATAKIAVGDAGDQMDQVFKTFEKEIGSDPESAQTMGKMIRHIAERPQTGVQEAVELFAPGKTLSPELTKGMQDAAESMKKSMADVHEGIISKGGNTAWLAQDAEDFAHFPRYASMAKEKMGEYGSRVLPQGHAGTKHRATPIAEVATEVVTRILKDPAAHEQGAAAHIFQNYGKYLGDGYQGDVAKHADEMAKWVGEHSRKWATEQRDLFTAGPADDYLKYQLGAQKANKSLDAIHELFRTSVADPESKHFPTIYSYVRKDPAIERQFVAAGKDPKLMADVLKRAGAPNALSDKYITAMNGVNLGDAFSRAGLKSEEALQYFAKLSGITVDQAANLRIDPKMADAARGLMERVTSPEWTSKVGEWVDNFNRIFKSSVTLPFPSFLVRNHTSGQVVNVTMGLESLKDIGLYVKKYAEAMGLLRNPEPTIVREMEAHGAIGARHGYGDVQMDVVKSGAVIPENALNVRQTYRQAAQSVADEPGMLDAVPGGRAWRTGFRTVTGTGGKVNQQVEWMNRVPLYLYLKEKGWTPAAAAKRVNELQFDYSDLSKAEKVVGRRAVPFYSFGRKMSELLANELMDRPGGLTAQMLRGTSKAREKERPMPEYVAGTTAIPLAPGTSGDARYLTGLGLAHEDPLSFIGGGVRGAMMEGISRMTPLVKAPLEWATGETFFQRGPQGGRELEDLDPTIGRTLANLVGQKEPVQTPKVLEFLLGNSPAARALTTTRMLSDPRKGATAKAVSALTGLKISDISDRALDAMAREQLTQTMRETPGSAKFTRVYFPKENLAEMNPEDRQRALQFQGVMNMLAKRAKERAKLKPVETP